MTDLEAQNQAYLAYATGGERPQYTYHPAPNAPGKPLSFEEQHMYDMDKACNLQTVLLRKWVNEQESRDAAVAKVVAAHKAMCEILEEAVFYSNDISHLEIYPRYVAHCRYLGGAK